MARRLYRDYSSDDETSWTVPRHDSPRSQDYGGRIEYGIAITKISDVDHRAKSPLHPGYGHEQTKDESYIEDSSSDTSYDEPIEDFGQVSSSRPDGTTTSIAVPPDVPKKPNSKRPMSPISEGNTEPGYSTPQAGTPTNRSMRPASQKPPSERHRDSMENQLPEFFSMSTFRTALYNPTISHHLFKFGQLRLSSENMEFLQRAHKFQTMVDELSQAVVDLQDEFVVPPSHSQIQVPEHLRAQTIQDTRAALSSTLPQLESLFRPVQTDLENQVYRDVYPKFVRHQMTLSATKALGRNRSQYAGLGDCFVLTDPSKADNPIVFASDGFVKVTGYFRKEIIPRNCRFLQGQSTHQASVKRLRKRINKKEESVELLLNYKKNGEPFWNLLYTTPLRDNRGKVIFFLGGQINCSTTIHSSSDVLKILAQSKDPVEANPQRAQSPQAMKAPPGRRFLNAFRSSSVPNVEPKAPGMEDGLLEKIENLPWAKQADTFYTAYSNFIVINYSTFLISFISAGLLDLLFPIKTAGKSGNASNNSGNYSNAVQLMPAASAVGTDVFKFLGNHGSGSIGWEFKSAVKNAMKAGNPVSLDMKLCARPYMGFEPFVLHWTPLKDESGSVHWIILTLGNDKRG